MERQESNLLQAVVDCMSSYTHHTNKHTTMQRGEGGERKEQVGHGEDFLTYKCSCLLVKDGMKKRLFCMQLMEEVVVLPHATCPAS